MHPNIVACVSLQYLASLTLTRVYFLIIFLQYARAGISTTYCYKVWPRLQTAESQNLPNAFHSICCFITVDFVTAASQNGFSTSKLPIHKKINIIQKMTKKH